MSSPHTSLPAGALWMFGLPAQDAARAATTLVEQGYSAVVLGDDEGARLARAAGLRAFACSRTFPVDPEREGEELLAVSARGGRYVWFGSGCPNSPELRARHLDKVREVLSQPWWDGFFLDGIRFASPNAGPGAFFTCFCARCEGAANRLGYDFARMRRDVARLEELAAGGAADGALAAALDASASGLLDLLLRLPGVMDWLRFRADCIVEHVRAVRQVVDTAPGKLLGAYLFTPSLAPLVGQPYHRLEPLLDVVSPMIYRLGAGDSGLSTELAGLARYLAAAARLRPVEAADLVLKLAGLHQVPPVSPLGGLAAALGPECVGREVARAAARVGGTAKLMPIIWLDDPLLGRAVAECREAAGLCLFVLTEATRARVGEATAAWREIRR